MVVGCRRRRWTWGAAAGDDAERVKENGRGCADEREEE